MTGQVDRRVFTGLIVQPLDRKVATYLDAPFVKGVVILEISKYSPADKSGLEIGDIILLLMVLMLIKVIFIESYMRTIFVQGIQF